MNLYIMTRGRVDKQTTWDNLPDSLREKTFIVCPEEETIDHPNSLPAPPWVKNYSDKFRWIFEDGMDDGNEKCVILDDDLTFSVPYTRDDGVRRLKTLRQGDDLSPIGQGFNLLRDLLDAVPLVGFHPRQMGHTKEPPYVDNGKIVCVQGINRKMAGDVPDLNKFPILADVILNATMLERGLGNRIITDLFIDWGACQAPGGCSITRTPEMQAEACYWLEERFGPYIKAVEKEAKNGWLGGKRVDFRGQWKKLYESGTSRLLDTRKRDNPEA